MSVGQMKNIHSLTCSELCFPKLCIGGLELQQLTMRFQLLQPTRDWWSLYLQRVWLGFSRRLSREIQQKQTVQKERKERVGLSCFQITRKKQWETSRGTTLQEWCVHITREASYLHLRKVAFMLLGNSSCCRQDTTNTWQILLILKGGTETIWRQEGQQKHLGMSLSCNKGQKNMELKLLV